MLLDFLEQLGVTFEMDWDNQVIITVPDELKASDVLKLIEQECFGKHLARAVKFRAEVDRAVFVGGLRNGDPICLFGIRWVANRVKRGRWEVYELVSDGRAFFRGYAASEHKAKRGEITEKQRARKGDHDATNQKDF